jgi:hypothetical protein
MSRGEDAVDIFGDKDAVNIQMILFIFFNFDRV